MHIQESKKPKEIITATSGKTMKVKENFMSMFALLVNVQINTVKFAKKNKKL